MSSNANLGSGKIEVKISELRWMKTSSEDLIKEIKSRTATVTAQARSVAASAYGEYSCMIEGQTIDVTSQCNTLATASSDALRELEALVKGLGEVIEGYLALENTLVASCDAVPRRDVPRGEAYTSI